MKTKGAGRVEVEARKNWLDSNESGKYGGVCCLSSTFRTVLWALWPLGGGEVWGALAIRTRLTAARAS